MGVMYRVCGLRLSLNFVVRLAAENNFYLRLTIAFAVFKDKYLRPYGCRNKNFTVTVNCTNPKTEILSGIMEIKIIGIKIDFLFFC